ncbi:ABC transporter substrate-binding protein [Pseudothauera rhizosphaerae]|uniref:ABC transporter substrate-binding protein n=1 Tax=Pseudothauera rhizosphaerae TaxID=2565932 RepID=A0A4S4ASA4_9RHOO|nr:ABC transporter substrate-binding protein [Pseudothauera rhizosphaerae]THF62721.1 ABC transporter substrate-binding protein [Pseudothauera rhizosphaerae]
MSTAPETLWYTRCGVPTSFGVAMHHGWIEERLAADGTAIRSLKESSDPVVRASHFDHNLQNSVRYGGSSPAIWARSTGRETRLLGLSSTRESLLLLAGPDSTLESVAGLRGKRFGVARWENQPIDFIRAQSLRALENALKLHGLTVADVELVDYPVGAKFADEAVHRIPGTQAFGPRRLPGHNAEVLGLIRGEVDAIVLHGAQALSLAHALQLRVLFDLSEHPDPLVRSNNASPIVLTADAHLLDTHPDTAASVVEQILRAERWAGAHPQEARQIAAREVNTSEYWIWKSYGGDEGLRVGTNLDPEALAVLQDFADFLLRWRFIATPVQVQDWIDPRPLETARRRLGGAGLQ